MKKIISLIIFFSLIFAFSSLALAEKNDNLEKIPTPAHISLFDKIIKKGNALWGIKRPEFKKNVYITPTAAPCVKTALDKKDTALKTAFSAYSSTTLVAIDSRNACQKTAIDKTSADEQWAANKLCLNNYQKQTKEAAKALRASQKTIRQVFASETKQCLGLPNATSSKFMILEEENDLLNPEM